MINASHSKKFSSFMGPAGKEKVPQWLNFEGNFGS
jgi:hypothetical protein